MAAAGFTCAQARQLGCGFDLHALAPDLAPVGSPVSLVCPETCNVCEEPDDRAECVPIPPAVCCPLGQHLSDNKCIECSRPERCLEYDLCVEGTTGTGCGQCDTPAQPPWVEQLGECKKCPDDSSISLTAVLFLGLVAVATIRAMATPHEVTSRLATNVASLITHLQCVSFSLKFDIRMPMWIKEAWSMLAGLVFINVNDVAPPGCHVAKLADIATYRLELSSTSANSICNDLNSDNLEGAELYEHLIPQVKTFVAFLLVLIFKAFTMGIFVVVPITVLTVWIHLSRRLKQAPREEGGGGGDEEQADVKVDEPDEPDVEPDEPDEPDVEADVEADEEQADVEADKPDDERGASHSANARLIIFGLAYGSIVSLVLNYVYSCKQGKYGTLIMTNWPVLDQDIPMFRGSDGREYEAMPCMFMDLRDATTVAGESCGVMNSWYTDPLFLNTVLTLPAIFLVVIPLLIFMSIWRNGGQARVGHAWTARNRPGLYWFELLGFYNKLGLASIASLLGSSPWLQLFLATSFVSAVAHFLDCGC